MDPDGRVADEREERRPVLPALEDVFLVSGIVGLFAGLTLALSVGWALTVVGVLFIAIALAANPRRT